MNCLLKYKLLLIYFICCYSNISGELVANKFNDLPLIGIKSKRRYQEVISQYIDIKELGVIKQVMGLLNSEIL